MIPTRFARVRKHTPGVMNALEKAYSAYLDEAVSDGTVLSWRFEALKLRLAERTFYTPDFFVVYGDDSCGFVEVKGFFEDDAKVKIKVAASQYPMFHFRAVFRLAKKHGGGWRTEEF